MQEQQSDQLGSQVGKGRVHVRNRGTSLAGQHHSGGEDLGLDLIEHSVAQRAQVSRWVLEQRL